jgi:hypothetical protein
VEPSEFLSYHPTSSRFGQIFFSDVMLFPLFSEVVVPARQAYSHCASVGREKE